MALTQPELCSNVGCAVTKSSSCTQ